MCICAARIAVQSGAAGIIVSNHGARQLDYVPSTIMALEEVLVDHLFRFHHLLPYLPLHSRANLIALSVCPVSNKQSFFRL